MALRLDKLKDREFLEKRLSKETLKSIYSSSSNSNHIDHRLNNLNTIEKTESSRIDKKNKYGNQPQIDRETGLKFDSIWELHCFRFLMNKQDAKIISELDVQVRKELIVKETKIATLVVDFYFLHNGEAVYADAKSKATSPPGFRIKKKLFETLYDTKLHLIVKGEESILDCLLK